MRVVVALGRNALVSKGESRDGEIQERHVGAAVDALVPLARDHDLVVIYGNGPEGGPLAHDGAQDPFLSRSCPYSFDTLAAQTQGMIGYWLLQALENELPGQQVVSLICQTLVDAEDPAFRHPTMIVGPAYQDDDAQRLALERGWQVRRDGSAWRRAVASPEPQAVIEMPTIRTLLGDGAVVVCAGGGGIPVCRSTSGRLHGADAVVDSDLTAAMLARDLGADALLLLTDVAAVEIGFGHENAQPIRRSSPSALRIQNCASGSMGPTVDAACRFVESTGRVAAIGRLEEAADVLDGTVGTLVTSDTLSVDPTLSPVASAVA